MGGKGTPIWNNTYDSIEDVLDPIGIFHSDPEGPTLNEQLQEQQRVQAPPEGIRAPDPKDAGKTALTAQAGNLKRKRASRTLFTGGQGVLDQPATASTTLLGV